MVRNMVSVWQHTLHLSFSSWAQAKKKQTGLGQVSSKKMIAIGLARSALEKKRKEESSTRVKPNTIPVQNSVTL